MAGEVLQVCTRCGNHATKSTLEKVFYISYSEYHKHNGRVHLCKDCIAELSLIGTEFSEEKFFNILRIIDKPYYHKLVESSIIDILTSKNKDGENKFTKNSIIFNHGSEIVGSYMRIVTMKQRQGESFNSGEQHLFMDNESEDNSSSIGLEFLMDKYGYGFKEEEYHNFERKYKKLAIGYTEKTPLHTERLITYIVHKVKEEMATADGNVTEAEKWAKIAQKDANDAKLNVSQLSKSDITGGIDLIPTLAEAIEENCSVIPIMPKLREVPYDDADMIIWALTNYNRRLSDKPEVAYSDVYSFYDDFLKEYYIEEKGLNEEEMELELAKRYMVFKDLGDRYHEPIYDEDDSEVIEEE